MVETIEVTRHLSDVSMAHFAVALVIVAIATQARGGGERGTALASDGAVSLLFHPGVVPTKRCKYFNQFYQSL